MPQKFSDVHFTARQPEQSIYREMIEHMRTRFQLCHNGRLERKKKKKPKQTITFIEWVGISGRNHVPLGESDF